MKKYLNVQSGLIAALAVASLALPACTNDQVAEGAIAVGAGVIIGGAIANDGCCYGGPGHYGPGYNHGGYIPPRPHGGFNGGHGGGGFGGGHGPGGGGHHSVVADSAATDAQGSDFKSDDARVQNVAAKYQISDYAATYVVRAIVMAQAKDMSGISEIGLETSDFETLYNGGTLENDKVEAMSQKLLMAPQDTATMVGKMTADIQAARN